MLESEIDTRIRAAIREVAEAERAAKHAIGQRNAAQERMNAATEARDKAYENLNALIDSAIKEA